MQLDKNSIKPFLQIYLFEKRCQYYKSDSGYPPVITLISLLFKFIDLKPVKGWKQKGCLDVVGQDSVIILKKQNTQSRIYGEMRSI